MPALYRRGPGSASAFRLAIFACACHRFGVLLLELFQLLLLVGSHLVDVLLAGHVEVDGLVVGVGQRDAVVEIDALVIRNEEQLQLPGVMPVPL